MGFNGINVEDVYKKDPDLKKNEVILLKQWVEKQGHLPNISELQAALFLHSCYYKQDAAKSAIDVYYTVRTLCPDLFQSRTNKHPGVKLISEEGLIVVLPMPTGESVILARATAVVEHFNFADHVKVFDAVLQIYQAKNGPSKGVHIVVDMKVFTFAHFLRLSAAVLSVKKFFYLLQEGLPVRMKQFHFINTVSFMDKVVSLVKPFLKKELLDNLFLHQNIDAVFEHIPKEVFPKDYGGSAESVKVIQENTVKLLDENEEFLSAEDCQRVDETKRSGPTRNINDLFGVEGSFKKLEFD